jgi:hypothetical protein
LCTIDIRFPVFEEQFGNPLISFLSRRYPGWQKGDRMLLSLGRMVRVALTLLSDIVAALSPAKVALRQVPVEKNRYSARRRA